MHEEERRTVETGESWKKKSKTERRKKKRKTLPTAGFELRLTLLIVSLTFFQGRRVFSIILRLDFQVDVPNRLRDSRAGEKEL